MATGVSWLLRRRARVDLAVSLASVCLALSAFVPVVAAAVGPAPSPSVVAHRSEPSLPDETQRSGGVQAPGPQPPAPSQGRSLGDAPQGVTVAPAAATSTEVLAEIRVHGNYATPDDTVVALAGLSPGQPIEPNTIVLVAERLRRSGRFADVEVRKRYRSLSDSRDVTIVIVVTEFDAASTDDVDPTRPPSLARRLGSSLMFLPVLDYTDGYGFTYGARLTAAGTLGKTGRLSVPLTWGGTRQAVAEFERTFGRVNATRFEASGGWSSRENPFYETDEERTGARAELSHQVVRGVRVAARAGVSDLTFGDVDERLVSYGAGVTIDTRTDPSFPRNAVLASIDWEGTDPRQTATFNTYRAEVHGYVAAFGPSVVAVGARYETADRGLPTYAQPLLGGASTLRGFRAGSFAGDNLFAASAELRVPFTSPLHVGQTGVAVFADTGTVYDHGATLADATFSRGFGAGLFVNLPIGGARLDVAHGVGEGTRVHVTLGIRF